MASHAAGSTGDRKCFGHEQNVFWRVSLDGQLVAAWQSHARIPLPACVGGPYGEGVHLKALSFGTCLGLQLKRSCFSGCYS